jgi:hypothetical protein
MAVPLSLNVPSEEITLGTTLTQLTGDTAQAVYLTILEAGATVHVALGPGLVDAGAAPTNYVPVPTASVPYNVWIKPHGFVGLFAPSGTPTCRVIVEAE